MQVTPIKTDKITPGSIDLLALLDQTLPQLVDSCVLAITSKIVSLCQNRVVPVGDIEKDELIQREADLYLPASFSPYGYHFTIINNTLIAVAGIDESNAAGHYVLWPENPQTVANQVRQYLKNKYGLARLGIIITDSTSHPLRRGAMGISIAWSGFAALKNYVGTPDLFGRAFRMEHADIAGGLAAAAVLAMGEGNEQTPLVVISDTPFVDFLDRDPTPAEVEEAIIPLKNDLLAPFLMTAPWQAGHQHKD